MLVDATKYTDVRAAARRSPSPGPRPTRASREHRGTHAPSPGPRRSSTPGAPAILVPLKPKTRTIAEWMERELREGGRLHEYLRVERAMTERRWRKVRARMEGFRNNPKSEWKLLAAVPRRDFHRWQQTDPDFWRDDANLRSLRRDNPDMAIFV
jgi:hypothetical protein